MGYTTVITPKMVRIASAGLYVCATLVVLLNMFGDGFFHFLVAFIALVLLVFMSCIYVLRERMVMEFLEALPPGKLFCSFTGRAASDCFIAFFMIFGAVTACGIIFGLCMLALVAILWQMSKEDPEKFCQIFRSSEYTYVDNVDPVVTYTTNPTITVPTSYPSSYPTSSESIDPAFTTT